MKRRKQWIQSSKGTRRWFSALVTFAIASLIFSGCANKNDTPQSNIQFVEVTKKAGIAPFFHDNGDVGKKWYPEQMGSGVGFFDYDGDGWDDILLLGGGTWEAIPEPGYHSLWLYKNNHDGSFTLTSEKSGLSEIKAYTIGFAAADFDNDGDPDIALSNLGTNMLLRNDDGVFTEIGREAGIADTTEWSSSVVFFDADLDGALDLFIGTYVDWSPETDKFCPEGGMTKLYCVPADYIGLPSHYFHNNGDGTFTDLTKSNGFYPSIGKSLGMVDLDYNHDGYPDLFVSNDGEGDLLYENNGDGTFSEKGMYSGVSFSKHGEARAGMGVDSGVIDSSGQDVLIVGNFSEEMVGIYKHIGNGLFMDYTGKSKLGFSSLLTLTFGLFLFDVDSDTDLDLFTANGHVYPDRLKGQDKITFRQRSQLYLNDGSGTFQEYLPDHGPFVKKMVARGAAYSDYDHDGDLDVLISENSGPAHLWRNESKIGAYLSVRLIGSESNRDGIDSRIIAVVNGLRMERRVRTGSSYLSQSTLIQTFGLGTHNSVDSLLVEWPSGNKSSFSDVQSNQFITITEDSNQLIQHSSKE